MALSSLELAELIVKTLADVAITNQNYFSELDGVCGDGDFGSSIATGFKVVTEDHWNNHDRSSAGTFLKDVSTSFMGSVGGVSGSIWGTAFLRCGIKAGDKEHLELEDFFDMAYFAIDGMKKRGKSDLGDKTLLDALVPAIQAWETAFKNGASPIDGLKEAAVVARAKTEEIKPWIAKRGRASYTGDRSKDTYDAGSIAVAMMFEKLVEVFS